MEDFKQCWLVLFTLSFIHFLANTKVELPGIVQEECVIVQTFREFVDYLKSQTGITEERINAVVNTISYDKSAVTAVAKHRWISPSESDYSQPVLKYRSHPVAHAHWNSADACRPKGYRIR